MSRTPIPRAVAVFAVVSGAFLALPFWVGRFVPLLDLPQHLAVVAVLRHHGDPAWGFARFFDVDWLELTPYWTHYLATWVLAHLVDVETASRVYLSAYALALPWAGILLARAFGRPAWLGLLAAPLALNTNLYFGFVAYCTAVVLLIVLLALFERRLDVATAVSAVALALGACILFFTHVQALAFFLAAAGLLAMTRASLSWYQRASRSTPLWIAAFVLLLPWVYREFVAARSASGGRYTFGRVTRLRASFQSPGEALSELPEALAGAFQDGTDAWIFAAWAGLVVWAMRGRAPGRLRALLPMGLALVLYFAAPVSIAGQWNIGPRFAMIAALLVIPALGATGPIARRIGIAAALLAVLAGINAARQHAGFDREAGALDQALAVIPRGARVMPLVFDARGGVLEKWPYLHAGQYAMVRRGGMTALNLGRVPVFPIRLLDRQAPHVDAFRPGDFRFETMGPAYDFFLLRSAGPWETRLFPPGSVERVFAAGEWVVLRRRAALL